MRRAALLLLLTMPILAQDAAEIERFVQALERIASLGSRVAQLVRELDAEDYATRERAQRALVEAGPAALASDIDVDRRWTARAALLALGGTPTGRKLRSWRRSTTRRRWSTPRRSRGPCCSTWAGSRRPPWPTSAAHALEERPNELSAPAEAIAAWSAWLDAHADETRAELLEAGLREAGYGEGVEARIRACVEGPWYLAVSCFVGERKAFYLLNMPQDAMRQAARWKAEGLRSK